MQLTKTTFCSVLQEKNNNQKVRMTILHLRLKHTWDQSSTYTVEKLKKNPVMKTLLAVFVTPFLKVLGNRSTLGTVFLQPLAST